MEAGDEHDPLAHDPEEQSVRESANEGAARLTVENWKGLGPFEHCLNAGEDFGQELLAEASASSVDTQKRPYVDI